MNFLTLCRPVPGLGQDPNTEVDLELEFNATSTVPIPKDSDIVETLKEAVTNPNSNFNLSLDLNTITVINTPATTTVPATTAITTAPPPVVELQVTLQQAFVPALTDPQSTEFKTLSVTITTICDTIFRQRYGLSFVQTTVTQFRPVPRLGQDPNTEVDLELEFNATSTVPIPKDSDIVETLKEAVTNPNSNFNLSLDLNSITVINTPATTTVPATTAITTAPPPVVELQVTLQQAFVPALTDPQSTEFKTLSVTITTICDTIFRQRYGLSFVQTTVTQFRPVPRLGQDPNTEVDLELEFNATSTVPIPKDSDIVETLKEAVTNPNSNFNLSLDLNSITVINTPATTTVPATTAITTAPPPVVELQVTLQQAFVPALTDPQSTEFKTLSVTITTICDTIFRQRYGLSFVQTTVTQFRPVPRLGQDPNTEVDLELEFNATSTVPIPKDSDIVETLKEAVTNPNSNFNLSLDLNSITVINTPATTTVPATTAITTAPPPVVELQVTLQQAFVPALTDPQSTEFKTLSVTITTICDTIFRQRYGLSFVQTTVTQFRPVPRLGQDPNTEVDLELEFNATFTVPIPKDSDIVETLKEAVTNPNSNFNLSLDLNSITVINTPATTTVPATTAITTAPPPVVELQVTLQQAFVPALTDPQSTEFKTLSVTITTICDTIFRQRYGLSFVQTTVTQFRPVPRLGQDPNTEVDLELEFNATSTVPIPKDSDIVETLKEAVTNPNSNFNLSLDLNSITVINTPATTTVPATTAITTAPPPVVELQVTLQQAFVPALTDPQSTEFKTLSVTITTICDTIFRQRYGLSFVQTTVTQFRPVPRLGQDPNTEVDLELEFNATSTVPIPKDSDIVETLKEAVTNPNSNFNLSLDLNSITVINTPATTTVPATTAITTAPPPVVELQVTLQQAFVPALTDPQSTEFKTLSVTITTICDTIFRQRYGLSFVQTTVTQFRPVPRLGQDPNTEVDLELEFNATSTVPIPKDSDIVETLKEAVTNPNSNFNLSLDLNSITVINTPATTTVPATTAITTAPPPVVELQVTLQQAFVPALTDPQSTEFKTLSVTITTICDTIFRQRYGLSFVQTTVTQFRPVPRLGQDPNTEVDLELEFNATSTVPIPKDSDIVETLKEAVTNPNSNFNLSLDLNSITVINTPATTTVPATTAITTAPPPVVELQVTLQQAFVPALTDPQSTEFKTLSVTITTICDTIFRQRYGLSFVQTTVTQFRPVPRLGQDPNTEVDLELEFNATSTVPIPKDSDIVETLKEAVTNPNSNFNLSLDLNSITVINTPATTTVPATTAITTAPPPVVELQVTLQQAFVPALTDPQSTEFKTLSVTITTICDTIFRQRYGLSFVQTTVTQFRPVPRLGQDPNTEVDLELEFNATSTVPIPKDSDIVETLKEAVTNPNSNFNLSLDLNSITVINTPATTTVPATTAITTAPPPVVELQVTLQQAFVPALTDPQSTEFKTLSVTITTICDTIFRQRYGLSFVQTTVTQFRPVPRLGQDPNTEVDLELEFNATSTVPIPKDSDIVETLKEAVTNPNSNFNLSLDLNSITVINTPATTTVPATTAITTAPPPVVELQVTLQQAFVPALTDPQSTEFKTLSVTITTICDTIFRQRYGLSFVQTTVTQFRPVPRLGQDPNTEVDLELEFNATSTVPIPKDSDIVETLKEAVTNPNSNFNLSLDLNSITVINTPATTTVPATTAITTAPPPVVELQVTLQQAFVPALTDPQSTEFKTLSVTITTICDTIFRQRYGLSFVQTTVTQFRPVPRLGQDPNTEVDLELEFNATSTVPIPKDSDIVETLKEAVTNPNSNFNLSLDLNSITVINTPATTTVPATTAITTAPPPVVELQVTLQQAFVPALTDPQSTEFKTLSVTITTICDTIFRQRYGLSFVQTTVTQFRPVPRLGQDPNTEVDLELEFNATSTVPIPKDSDIVETLKEAVTNPNSNFNLSLDLNSITVINTPATTTVPATTAITTAPPPVVELQVTLQQAFVPALTDPQSTEFKTLSVTITTICDTIFRQRYGLSFVQTTVTQFRPVPRLGQDPNTEVDLELEFNATSTVPIPKDSDIVETLKEAVTNPNSNFNLSLDLNSITVINTPATTTVPATTAITTAPPPVVELQVTLQQAFVPALTDPQSTEFKTLSVTITTICDTIFRQRYGLSFVQTTVTQFRPVPRLGQDPNTEVDLELEFNATSTVPIPKDSDIVETLKEAVTNPNSNFNLSLDLNSITVINTPATTTVPATTAITTAPPPVVELQVTLQQAFVPALTDPQSTEFKTLSVTITTICDTIFRQRYGLSFVQTTVTQFRPVPRLGQDPNTEVDLELEFNATSTVPIPKDSDIVETLKEAVTNPNSNFNLSLDLNSITVINTPATTTVPATTAITTAPPPVVELQVTLQQAFVPALTDPQSTEFKTLSVTITTICDTIFRQRYGLSFVQTTVTQFRPVPRLGQDPNTEVDLELEFNATSTVPIPKDSDIVETLKEAVTNPNSNFNLSLDLNSITVINTPATTTVPATTAITTAPPPVVELQVTLQQAFVPALTDPQSTEFKTLSVTITTICDTIFRQRYGLSFVQTTVTQFRPVPRLGQDPNTEVDLELEFNATSTVPIPKDSDIVETLKEAVTNPNSNFNLSLDLNSITVINTPATTTVPATTAITTAPPPVVELQVTLQQAFVPALTDPQSTEFKTLSVTITTICDTIFRQRYGLSFVQTTVTQFRPVPRLGQDPNTEVDLELEFNATSTVPIPKDSDIVETLKEAVTNPNSNFNLSLDLNSITVINTPATTTVPATTAITTAPPPVVELQVTLQQAFVPALTDPQSTEFKTLSVTITTICDTIFRQRYGLSFVQTTVTQFRPVPRLGQDPNTEVDLELEFNATSTVPIPKDSDIVETLKEAVTNPNSNFNLSLDLNSITVINTPATTTVPATTAITTAPPPVVELQVTLQQAFVPALTDPQSTEFKTLSVTITTICDTIFRQRYGLSFVQTTVTQFRPVPRLGQDPNTEVDLELEFNATSTVPIPKDSDIVETLKEAVTNPNSNFNLSLDLNSITVINTPATTTVPATTAITTAPPPVVELQVTLQQAFVPALTDPQSTEFKTLSVTITTICDTIFRQRYGLSFVQTTVTQFRPVPRLGQDPNTEVDLELEFNATSTVPIPKDSDIVETLKEAVTNPNSNFNLSLDLNSITVINTPATTTVPATTAITTAPPPVVELQVTLQQAFVPALTDPQSTEFKTLSVTITTICDTIFRQRYGLSFVQTTVTQFRPVPRLGQDPNTEVDLELEFNATSTVPIPKDSDIVETLKEAVTNPNSNFNLSLDLNSITVINTPATTTVPATTAITTAPPPVVELQVTLQQAFVPALTDPQSTEFKTLSVTITTICDTIFRQRYGLSFVQTTVTQFRPVPRLGQDPNTEVDLELEFNATSTVPIPKDSDIVETLKEAVTNPNSNFNLSLDLNSITVINTPATTTVPATTAITTAPPPVVELQVTLQQAFVPALTDPQSTEFKTLSVTITTICDTIFRQRYGLSFVQTTVTQFRPVPRLGQDPNTEVDLELEFNATSTVPIPKDSDIVETLKEAVTNPNSNFNLSLDLNSITVINTPATTTVPATTAITTAPPPVVELQVTLQQAFVPALTDPQSTEFKTLSVTITTICDTIFRQRYGLSFVQTTVTQFRPVPRLGQDPNTEVDLELEFNATSTVPIPKDSDIVETLKEAVTNPNSNFNLSLDLNSITVINTPATTTVPATTAITTAPPPVVELQVTLQQAFVPALTDPQSTEFKTLSVTITTICDTIFRQRYGLSFVQTTVTQFRPVPRLGQDPNTEVDLELEFNATSTVPIPKDSDIVETLKEAVTNPNSNFNLSLDLNSITVINTPATTTVPATTAITTAPPPVVELQVTLQQAFVPALTDPQSTEFKTLSVTITTICDTIFRQRYGLSFVQTTVTQFRPVPRLGQDPNTEVDLELEFNATSTVPIPKDSDIVETLKEAVTNPNSNFNLSLDLNSITVINTPATTTVPATTAITTAPPPVVELQVTLQQAFVPALTDPQSTEFKTLSVTITTICDTIFRQRYGLSFVQTTVTQFRPVPRLGQDPNTEVDLELEFNATSTVPIPKDSDIVETLKEAVTNPNSNFNLSLDLNSITVINTPATTTVPATTAITTAPPPVVELQVTLQQAFVPALTDPQSTEFKTLSVTITTICDTIFRQRYGLSFVQTTVTQFRPVPRLGQDPNTEVDLELEFNATSTVPIPKDSDIVETLKEAVTNPNSNFNLSLDLNSITVINTPATTTVPATTAITTAPPPVVELQVTLQQAFVPALTDPQSTEFKTLSVTITTICDTIFRQRYGLSFVQTTVTQFRPVPRLGQDPNTEVDLELEFNATSTVPIPKDSDIVETLKEAVTNPNSNFNLSLDLNSITVINTPATTTVPATTAITTAPPPVVELQVTLQQAFVPALTDPQSTEFKTLSVTITTICDTIFRQRYGLSFVQTTVTQFRPVPRLGQDPNTEVDLELEFNATSTVPIPKDSDIVETLKEAVTNPNSNFNLSLDLNSITVINTPATTTVPATTAITTAPPPVVELQVTLQQAFVPALTDPQSTEFKTLSVTITTICDTIFRQRYGLSFVQTTVTQFRPVPRLGQDPNTEVDLELEFNATSTVPIPKDSDIVETLKEAVTNPNSNFNLSLDLNSITVINTPATTTVPATTAITTAPPPVVELQVTLQQAFVPALTDPQSTEFKTLSVTITTICDTIFRQRYGLSFVQTTVTQFRPVPRLGQDPNTEVDLELEFNATSTVPIPKDSDIVETLKEAVTNPNSNFNLSLDLNSITVINTPATTTVPATTAITTAPPPVVELQVTLQQAFVPALTDPQSTEFKTLSVTITTICDTIFRQRYGLSFVQTTVTQFRPVPGLGQDPNTEVDLELEFNATSTVPIPKDSDIVETLKEAVTNPNSNFNLSLDLNSITVINTPATTTVPATTAITTAPPPVVELQVTLQQAFVPALTDPQSTEFKTLSVTITTICDTIFRQRYGLSFVQTTVTQFRPVPRSRPVPRLGQDPNTEVDLELEFNATSTVPIPKDSDIVETLKEAVTNPNSNFNLSLDLNSITVISSSDNDFRLNDRPVPRLGQDPNTEVDLELEFNATSTVPIPKDSDIVETLKEAVTNPNSNFNLSLDLNSITVISSSDNDFRLNDRPVPRLGQDPNTEVDLELEFNATSTVPIPKDSDIVETLKEAVTNPNSNFNLSLDLNSITVISSSDNDFRLNDRPVPRLGQDPNTEVDLELEFNATSTVPIPKDSDIVETLKEAVTNPNSNFNLSLDLNSITVISSSDNDFRLNDRPVPRLGQDPNTEVDLELEFNATSTVPIPKDSDIVETLKEAVTNPNSNFNLSLDLNSITVISSSDNDFRLNDRPVPRLGQDPNTEVDLELEFNATSTVPIPKDSDIVETLKEAVTNPNSNFNLSLDLNSITVISSSDNDFRLNDRPVPRLGQDPNTEVDLELEFNATSTVPIPKDSDIVETLKEAVTNPNSNFNLSLVLNSITVISSSDNDFRLNDRPVPRLGQDPNTEVDLELEFNATSTVPIPKDSDIVETLKEAVTNPNSNFNLSLDLNSITVISSSDNDFRLNDRPVPRLGQDPNTEVDLELEFNATSTVPIPKDSDIVETLKEAVTNPNSNFNLSLDLNSITVISSSDNDFRLNDRPVPRLGQDPNTEVDLELEFNATSTVPIPKDSDIVETLKEAVTNPNSNFNLSLVLNSITVISSSDNDFRLNDRPVPRLGQDPNTEVDLELEFNATSTVPIPKDSDIVETLKEAVTNPNSNFNLSLDLNSITVISKQTQSIGAPKISIDKDLKHSHRCLNKYNSYTYCNINNKRNHNHYFHLSRPVFRSRMAADTQVVLEVVFNETAIATIANATMPKDIDIKDTLKEAATNPNSAFNLSVVPNSITIISKGPKYIHKCHHNYNGYSCHHNRCPSCSNHNLCGHNDLLKGFQDSAHLLHHLPFLLGESINRCIDNGQGRDDVIL
uniref:uncharacterized protein LOC124012232 n=1 Tax=Oncorhynchus gorbuscha TaxID=8017 RepID=UPI001EAF82A0|nr:uncharacterized protein LOC124012232 [Oncorhynchus gorbuscha]